MARLGRSFAGLWAATGLTNLGDGLYLFALPLIAVDLTDSPGLVAGLTVVLTAAWPLFGLPAGGLVDRVNRHRLMMVANLARAGTLALLAAALATGTASVPLLYAVALLLGVAETLVDTAQTAMVPAVVDRAHLGPANTRIEATQTITNQFVGPPLAGLVAIVGLAHVAGLSAATYAAAVPALLLVRGVTRPAPAHDGTARREPFRAHLASGLRYMWGHHLVRTLTVLTALMNVFWAAWTAVLVLYVVDPGPVGLSPTGYGVLLTAMAAGGLLGSLVVQPARRLLGTRPVLALDVIGTSTMLLVPAATTNVWLIAVSILVGGAGSAAWRVISALVRQLTVPEDMLGRVYGASRTISWGVLPLGALLGGVIAEVYGVRAVFVVGGIASVGILGVFLATVRPGDLAVLDAREPAAELTGARQ